MSISLSKLNYLKDTKTHLKNAIVDAGVEVLDSDPFISYVDRIASIKVSEAPVDDGVIKITSCDISEFDNIYSSFEEVFGENMQGLFLGIFAKNLDWTVFNTLKNTDFTGFFAFFYGLQLDIANLDTSYATSLSRMFWASLFLENLDLSNFNTSNVTDMSSMFDSCGGLTTLDLSNFDTSNVTNMSGMFSSCSNLITILFGNNWAANSEITSLDIADNPLSKESILDLANKIADKSSLSSAATVTLKSSQQSLFTEDELSSLTTTFSNKNWTLTWS